MGRVGLLRSEKRPSHGMTLPQFMKPKCFPDAAARQVEAGGMYVKGGFMVPFIGLRRPPGQSRKELET